MAAPEYVPPSLADQPRASLPLPANGRWTATRPGDLQRGQPLGTNLGRPGPDQGYALLLAERFNDRLHLAEGEHTEDAMAGAVAVAMRRASVFGRAPVIHDLEHAFGVFGFLDDPAQVPPELLEWRRRAFRGAGHDYWDQREIVDGIPDATLRVTPAEIRRRLSDWKALVGAQP